MKIRELLESDEEHQAALRQTGFWGRQGAGCIILAADTCRICLPHRSEDVEEPETWGTWGGAIDSGENPMIAAQREVVEEAGYSGAMKMVPLFVFRHKSEFTYHNFLAIVEHEFSPILNWETQGFRWVEFGKWPRPLHPGLKSLLSNPESINTIKSIISRLQQSQATPGNTP